MTLLQVFTIFIHRHRATLDSALVRVQELDQRLSFSMKEKEKYKKALTELMQEIQTLNEEMDRERTQFREKEIHLLSTLKLV